MNNSLPFYALANVQRLFVVALVLLCATSLEAQTPKVAFVGVTRTDSPDGFSFVAGESLPASSTIYFTDEEYREACGAFHFDELCEPIDDGEPFILYTAPNDGVAAGEVVTISETSANTFTVGGAGGTAVLGGGGNFTLAASECLFAFATSDPSDPQDNVTEVYAGLLLAEAFDGSVEIGDDPREDYPNAIVTILNASDGEYTPSLRNNPADAASIMDLANWTIVNPPANLALSPTPFTGGIDLSPAACVPVINGVSIDFCPTPPNDGFVISVDGSLNGATAWGVAFANTGTCGSYIPQLTFQESLPIILSPTTPPIVIFSIGDCQAEQVCFEFEPYEVFGLAQFSLDNTAFCETAEVQMLGGGTPVGGTYSGPGVTDSGDGMNFSFDPAAAGVGTHSIIYTPGAETSCPNITASVDVTVTASTLSLDLGPDIFPPNTSQCYSTLDFTTITGGSGNYSYLWDVDGSIFNSTSLTICPFANTTTTLIVTDNMSGCRAFDTLMFIFDPAIAFDLNEDPICIDAGVQMGLGGATPTGGSYSGSGVTDDGNGMTFSFDPMVAGAGDISISYSFGTSTASSTLTVAPLPTVSFTSSLSTVGLGDGAQSVSGGSPMGGIYSGTGVTDDGNGMSFTFDPAAAGAGTTTVTYNFTDANGCSNSATADIEVTNIVLPGDVCGDAIDISGLFGGPVNTPQISDVQDNTDYNPDNDPGAGYECWFGDQPVLNNTIWFAFTGDGEKYTLRSIQCDTINPMINTDTQFALYSGDCTTPVAVACNDDEDFDNQVYNSFLEITTEVGVDYLLMVDGYVAANDYAAIGTFCLEVNRLETVGVQDIRNTEFNVYPNPTTGWVQLDGFTADQIEVLDQLGRTVRTQAQAGNGVDLSGLPAGVYLLRMTSGTDVYSAKVVKE